MPNVFVLFQDIPLDDMFHKESNTKMFTSNFKFILVNKKASQFYSFIDRIEPKLSTPLILNNLYSYKGNRSSLLFRGNLGVNVSLCKLFTLSPITFLGEGEGVDDTH